MQKGIGLLLNKDDQMRKKEGGMTEPLVNLKDRKERKGKDHRRVHHGKRSAKA